LPACASSAPIGLTAPPKSFPGTKSHCIAISGRAFVAVAAAKIAKQR
jgi:hypothetical protein